MQTYQNLAPLEGAHNMASFVARLMSLNAHELQCLHSDSELMRHLTETQLLMESRLQNISFQNKINNTIQQQQQQQQHQISPSNYYDYYSQAVALSAVASQQQQQQQHQLNQQQQLQLLISSHNHLQNPLALDLRTTPTSQPLVYLHHQQQQQQQHQHQPLFANHSSPSSLNTPSTTQLHHYSPSATPNSTTTTTSTASQHHLNQDCITNNHNNKKIKLSNNDQVYQSQILINSHHNHHHNLDANSRSSSTSSGASSNSSNASLNDNNNITTRKQTTIQGEKRNSPPNALNSNNLGANVGGGGGGSNKKYKGEFDEPSPNEVEERQRMLERSDNYHTIGTRLGECACVLGSQFRDKSTASVLASINKWRHLDTEERIKSKWDVVDLPKDIPLSDIKKFEDLRREASNGRADFGGASKRKPLGIRGTRQFLLILYCLWGHPGRDDVMQKEGYCPHCFAKIKKANEQSTLVRVVNHFNMKHRRGANPRLSPNRDTTPTSAAAGAAKTTPTTTNTSNSKTTAKTTTTKSK